MCFEDDSTLLIILVVFFVACGFSTNLKGDMEMDRKHVVLLGASVGREWNITSLPERLNNQNYAFEYVGFSGFDKSEALKEIFTREENKPDIVILKECAAYFPGDFEHYKSLPEDKLVGEGIRLKELYRELF